MPENEATFAITAGGIADAKDWENMSHSMLWLPQSFHVSSLLMMESVLIEPVVPIIYMFICYLSVYALYLYFIHYTSVYILCHLNVAQ